MMTFSGIGFMVGKVQVDIAHIDLDKLTTHINVIVPLGDVKLTFKFYSGFGWNEERSVNFEVDIKKEKPDVNEDEILDAQDQHSEDMDEDNA